MSLAELPVEEYESRTETFFPQMSQVMCYSTCLTNLMNDLIVRYKLHMRKFTISRMNKLCGYQDGIGCNDPAIPHVMEELLKDHEFKWKEERGPGMNLDRLKEIIENPRCSLVLANVHLFDYCDAIGLRTSGRKVGTHALIVMGVNHDIVYLSDPMENYLSKSAPNWRQPKYLSKPAFLSVWDKADEPRWVAWAERLPTVQKRLDQIRDTNQGGT